MDLKPDLIVRYLYWKLIPFETVVELKGIGKFKKSVYDDTLMTFFVDEKREQYLRKLIVNHWNRGTFVDIGANIGIFSVMAAKNKMQVVAFEPSSKNLNLLKENIDLNAAINISAFDKAIGASGQVGYLSFDGSKSKVTINGKSNVELIEFFNIELLEDLLTKPVFCKIDVEGFELDVLREITAFDFDEIIVEVLDADNLRLCIEILHNYQLVKQIEDNYHFVKSQ